MNELWIILISALPVVELRGAIPLALGVFSFSPLKAFLLSIIGNLLLIPLLLLFLNKFSGYLMSHNNYIRKFLIWIFKRTRLRHSKKFEVLGSLALFSFTAIPLPFTGAWSACVAAFVFGIDTGKAILFISLGVLTAGVIVLGLTMRIL